MSRQTVKVPEKISAIYCNGRTFFVNGTSVESDLKKKDTLSEIDILNQRITLLENELQAAREEAFASGLAEGQSQANSQFAENLDVLTNQFADSLENLTKGYFAELKKLTEPVVHLSRRIAEKILERELHHPSAYTEIITQYMHQFFDELSEQDKITLHVSREVHEVLEDTQSYQNLLTSLKKPVSLAPDSSLLPGECIIETEDHRFESLIKNYLDKIETELVSL